MKKKILSCVILLCMFAVLVSCSTKKDDEIQIDDSITETSSSEPQENINTINVAALKGPTAIGLVKMMDDDSNKEYSLYDFNIYGTSDEIVTGIINGKIDVACVPCNLASVLYNKTHGEIQVGAINTLGVLYITESGNSINKISDLKGKTIYTTGKGTTPEYSLRYILSANGIDPDKDVNIEFKTEATEIASMYASSDGSADIIAMLPQPYVTVVTMNNSSVRVALDMSEAWKSVAGDNYGEIVTGVLIVRKSFYTEKTKEYNDFITQYNSSVAYTQINNDETAKIVDKFGIFKYEIAKKAIPDCHITFIDGSLMYNKINSYLSALYSQNPASIGGNMPGDDFYIGISK